LLRNAEGLQAHSLAKQDATSSSVRQVVSSLATPAHAQDAKQHVVKVVQGAHIQGEMPSGF